MNEILLKSILAMDSYNRGYEPAINLSKLDANGTPIPSDQIGNNLEDVTIKSASLGPTIESHGFYAVAYQYIDANSATQTVIAYRGTDNFFSTTVEGASVGGDIANAYGVGDHNLDMTQATDAMVFYKAVSDLSGVGNITLTGHSMGGGLAGMVSELTGKLATVFDSMAFDDAVKTVNDFGDNSGVLMDNASDAFFTALNGTHGPVDHGVAVPGYDPATIYTDTVTSIVVKDQFLSLVPGGADPSQWHAAPVTGSASSTTNPYMAQNRG